MYNKNLGMDSEEAKEPDDVINARSNDSHKSYELERWMVDLKMIWL